MTRSQTTTTTNLLDLVDGDFAFVSPDALEACDRADAAAAAREAAALTERALHEAVAATTRAEMGVAMARGDARRAAEMRLARALRAEQAAREAAIAARVAMVR